MTGWGRGYCAGVAINASASGDVMPGRGLGGRFARNGSGSGAWEYCRGRRNRASLPVRRNGNDQADGHHDVAHAQAVDVLDVVLEPFALQPAEGGLERAWKTLCWNSSRLAQTTRDIAANIAQASQGLQEVNENGNQSSAVATTISRDIAGVGGASTQLAENGRKVRANAGTLQQLTAERKEIVQQFRI